MVVTQAFVREAYVRFKPGRRKVPALPPEGLTSSRDVDRLVRRLIPGGGDAACETLACVHLDAKNRPIGYTTLSGGLTSCPVAPMDVFRAAVMAGAASIVIAHNHPSGDPTPSAEDIALTERLRRGADCLGMRLLDHVIVAADGYFSFLDAGLLSPAPRREAW